MLLLLDYQVQTKASLYYYDTLMFSISIALTAYCEARYDLNK
jgi:hypothetical protein